MKYTRTSSLQGRRTTNCAMVNRVSELIVTKRSNNLSNKVEIWQNLGKNSTPIMVSSPIKSGRKITKPITTRGCFEAGSKPNKI